MNLSPMNPSSLRAPESAQKPKGTSGRSYRSDAGLTVQPHKGKRKPSSRRWLERHLNDRFVAEARQRGFRSRAAIKLEQMNHKYKILFPHARVVDLGCAPGGWLQVVANKCQLHVGKAILVGVDVLPVEPIAGAEIFTGDINDPRMLELVMGALVGKADIVLSDMAAPTTGHRQTDYLRTMGLLEMALEFAEHILDEGGTFLAKSFQGGHDNHFNADMRKRFEKVRYVKPEASRAESVETYLLARNYRKEGIKR